MDNSIALFTTEEGNFLIRLFIAHFISDFAFQTTYLVETKKWFSKSMALHIAIVGIITFALTGAFYLSIILTILHWLTDGLKLEACKKFNNSSKLFFADQAIHLLTIIVAWLIYFNNLNLILSLVAMPFIVYKYSLILLAYLWVIFPLSYVIKNTIKGIDAKNDTKEEDSKLEHGGKLIGQFERIIILTFVLLNQYEAIGFLITGKSIIRFADHNSNLRSEYVLVGTMISYALAIISGVIVNALLNMN